MVRIRARAALNCLVVDGVLIRGARASVFAWAARTMVHLVQCVLHRGGTTLNVQVSRYARCLLIRIF